jgi:2-dehydropantoate 2-reductase
MIGEYASDAEDTARRANLLSVQPIGNQPRGGGSSWQSLRRRTGSIETDFLNGEIVQLGRLHDVPTPRKRADPATHERNGTHWERAGIAL